MLHVTPEFIGLCLAAAVFAIERYTPLLDRFKKKSAADAAAELAISEQTIGRLRSERNKALQVAQKLEQTRSLEPVLDLLKSNAELQAQVLDRLVHHNGSFKHMELSLAEIHEGLRLITGFIAGIVDLPIGPPIAAHLHQKEKP